MPSRPQFFSRSFQKAAEKLSRSFKAAQSPASPKVRFFDMSPQSRIKPPPASAESLGKRIRAESSQDGGVGRGHERHSRDWSRAPYAQTSRLVGAGENWRALKKTLDNGKPSHMQPRRPQINGHSTAATWKGKGKGKDLDDASRTSSPAPRDLPWFAEDLSPEDLALVTGPQSVKPGQAAGWTGVSEGDAQELKKKIILGGNWDGDVSSKSEPGHFLAVDCEMVGVGPKGSESVLARVSIVNWHGFTLLDRFVKPKERVTDYRTWVSGVRAVDLKGAPSFETVQAEVADLIKGRVLVGHAIQNDLQALLLSHPLPLIRDTSKFDPLRKIANTKQPSLKTLVHLVLGIDIQKMGAEHSSVEDARATMAIFRTQKVAWEQSLRGGSGKGSNKAIKGQKEDQHKNGEKEAATELTGDANEADTMATAVSQIKRKAKGSGLPIWQPPPKKRSVEASPGWWKK